MLALRGGRRSEVHARSGLGDEVHARRGGRGDGLRVLRALSSDTRMGGWGMGGDQRDGRGMICALCTR